MTTPGPTVDDVRDLAAARSPETVPRPTSERWQPLRLGLVDLFYYDDEQFWFHDGRLLLRGNNGTGKSKVLALTLPFLLDGSTRPHRVEPDADPKKKMEWNLLLGGAHTSSERTGYSWVEFGRVAADGTESFVTLGIGLKAAAGRGIVKSWYFTSTRRVGDLHLLDPSRTVLSQERLREELITTGSGQVYSTGEAYRRAVDEALFQLGDERYAALVDLLIQLRQPQLSKKPDQKALSAALTEALAPLDQAVVADVAESFRSLEEERAGIVEAKETLAAAERFLGHYRNYAGVASRRHTTAVRLANSTYEHAGRDLREAQEQLVGAEEEFERLAGLQEGLEERRDALQGEDRALRESPEMRDSLRLDRASRDAAEAEQRTELAAGEAEQATARAEQETHDAGEWARRQEQVADASAAHQATAGRYAVTAGLGTEHPALVADAEAAQRAVARRRDQVKHVRRLVDQALAARLRAADQRRSLDTAESDVVERGEDVRATREAVDSAVDTYREAVRTFVDGLVAVVPDARADELADAAEGWARSPSGEPSWRSVVETAATRTLTRIGRERGEAAHEAQQLGDEVARTRAAITDLEAGRDPVPPMAPGREPEVRDVRAGAPLWLVTDFVDSVPDAERAGTEAALESAGLLDAWIFPDGTIRAEGDVVLGPTGPETASSLADVLVPAVGAGPVGEDAVAAVLRRIGWGEQSGSDLWVDHTGGWGSGPARGSWGKDRAEFIGGGAREAHRRDLITALRTRAEELEAAQAAVVARVDALDAQATEVRREQSGFSRQREQDLASVHERAGGAQRELERVQDRANEARERWERAVDAEEQAAAELTDQAAQLDLGTTPAELDETAAAVSDYAQALVEVRGAARALADTTTARDAAAGRAADAVRLREKRESEHRDVRAKAAGLRAECEALRSTVGASVAELQARLDETTTALVRVVEEIKQATERRYAAAATKGTLKQKVDDLDERREEASAAREQETLALRVFAGTGLLRVALPELVVPGSESAEEWTITAAIGLSRTAEQQLHDAEESDDAWSRAQQRVSSASTELAAQMSRHGHTSFVEQRGEVLVARVRYVQEDLDVDVLVGRLSRDVAERERLLSAREREILENHLVNEVAGHLHELLATAAGQIDRMNRELAERKTSTGMHLRVLWAERDDGPAGLQAARGLMARSDATWTPEDRAAIGEFLQARIAEVRDADPTGGWQEHLGRALDYRHWHTFVVERWQNGRWRPASGPASGGEKALAVTVPLFAAAAAHYNSAGPLAPRLILLDEAFAGVDDDSRAKSLGLLATFDLDVVMTSEREWGCYPQVPGLSIAQLSRVEGIDAVGVTRWRWDGRRRWQTEDAAPASRAGGDVPASSGGPTLFA